MKLTSFFRPLLLLLGGLSVQSCSVFLAEGSIDLVKNHFTGLSYDPDDGPPTGSDIGANLAGMYLLEFNKALSNMSVRPPTTGSLVASTRNQLSFSASNTPAEPGSFFKSEHFAIMTGGQLIRKGNRFKDSFGTDITHLLYLEMPVYALYRYQLPDNKGQFFGGLGPYFGYGLTGTFKYTFNGQTTKLSAFDTKNGGYKRFDAGLALTAGYQFPSSIRVRLAYELGLTNIQSGASGPDDDRAYNRAFSVNVGYPLGKIVDKFKKK